MRKRSRHRPKTPNPNPIRWVTPHTPEAQKRIIARLLSSLDAIAACKHPGVEEWRDLADVVNVIETIAASMRLVEADAVMPSVWAASEAMQAAATRFKAGGGMRFDGPGLAAMRVVVDLYCQCAESILTPGEMAVAWEKTRQAIVALQRAGDSKVVLL